MKNVHKDRMVGVSNSYGVFLFVSFTFMLISLHLVSVSIGRFESAGDSGLWDAKFSLFNMAFAIVFISISLSTSQVQLNMAFFWIFQYVFFGIGGLLSQLDPYPYYLTKTSTVSDLTSASRMIFVAQISAGFAQLLQMKYKQNSKAVYRELYDSEVSVLLKRVNRMLKIYLFSVPIMIYQLGGLPFLLKRVRVVSLDQNLAISINAILQTLLYVPPVVALMLLIYLEKIKVGSRFTQYVLIIWILFLSNPLANARQTTLFLILPFFFYFLQSRRRIAILFFSILPLFFVYSAGVVNRYTGELQSPRLSVISRDGDFDSFSQVANGLRVVAQGEFEIFRQILASLFFFIPRSIYPGKPNDTGVELAKILGLKFQNLSAPWILESYVNARLAGVVFVSILIGFYLTKLDLKAILDVRYFLLGSLTSGFLFIVLRGSLLQATGRVAFSIFIVLILLKGVKQKSTS